MEYFVLPADVIFAPFARYTNFMNEQLKKKEISEEIRSEEEARTTVELIINFNVSNILNMEEKDIIGKLASYLGSCYS